MPAIAIICHMVKKVKPLATFVVLLLILISCSNSADNSADSNSKESLDTSVSEKEDDCFAMKTAGEPDGEINFQTRPGFEADESDPEPIESTGANKLDLIRESDPTTFKCLKYLGQGDSPFLPASKEGEYSIVADTYKFRAGFDDDTSIEIRVHPEIGDLETVEAEVDKYTKALGQLPHILRADVCRLNIRNGDQTATASFLEGMMVQTENMETRIKDNRLEETLFHEAVHTSLDYKFSYQQSQEWLDAQEADGKFLTSYGREVPDGEDFAETALYAWALQNHPERIPADQSELWQERVPNRIEFMNSLFDEAPTRLDEEGSKTCELVFIDS